MPQLYPVFELPELYAQDEESKRSYLPAPMFDFTAGDFVRDGANRITRCEGKEAYRQWCEKMLSTQLDACLAYPDCGVDGENALLEERREAAQAALEKTIEEALARHPATRRVKAFHYTWKSDAIVVGFTVESVDWAAFDMNLNVTR